MSDDILINPFFISLLHRINQSIRNHIGIRLEARIDRDIELFPISGNLEVDGIRQ